MNDPHTIARLDATKMPKKAMMGTPWYTVLSNATYQAQFGYIGAFTTEREKLLEDGLADELEDGEITERCTRAKCSQSDLVMLLLNITYIPDAVVAKLDFDEGWQARFKNHMLDYRKAWKTTHGSGEPWRYQDDELEAQCLTHKDKAQEDDPVFQSEKRRIAALVKEQIHHTEDAGDAGGFKRMDDE